MTNISKSPAITLIDIFAVGRASPASPRLSISDWRNAGAILNGSALDRSTGG
jgi:hypothetical protein